MKTIEEVKNYLKNELELKQVKMLTHYNMYKISDNKLIKETAKEFYMTFYHECSILEKILKEIEG